MSQKQLQQQKVHSTRHSFLRRVPSWFVAVFVMIFLVISWILWGRGFFGSGVKLVIDSSIDQSDERIDYQVLQRAANAVGSELFLQRPLAIHIQSCDDANAYYDVGSYEVILCDQLIDDFVETFEKVYDNPVDVRDAATNGLVFIAFHELGHALIDVLDIPITGREEDVADQLSTYLLIRTVDNGAQYVLDGAQWFGVTSEQYDIDESDFADEHSLDAQRYYTLACWVYGSDVDRFGDTVLEGGLTSERASGCVDEYTRFSRSWEILLTDHMR